MLQQTGFLEHKKAQKIYMLYTRWWCEAGVLIHKKRYRAYGVLSWLLPALFPNAASLGNLLGDLCVKWPRICSVGAIFNEGKSFESLGAVSHEKPPAGCWPEAFLHARKQQQRDISTSSAPERVSDCCCCDQEDWEMKCFKQIEDLTMNSYKLLPLVLFLFLCVWVCFHSYVFEILTFVKVSTVFEGFFLTS